MVRWTKRIAVLLAGLIGFAFLAAWLLLSSSFLAKTRGELTAQFLTQKLGQTVEINGGVRIELGSTLHVVTDGVALPSQTMPDVRLAEIDHLSFDIALGDLLNGQINLSALHVEGAAVQLIAEKDGTMSWSMANKSNDTTSANPKTKGNDGNLAGFLAGQSIKFVNTAVTYLDARNGLDIDLHLTSFELSQKDGSAPVVLQGAGSVNGQDLTLNGNFPPAQPFRVTAAFSQLNVKLEGTPGKDGYKSGFATAISVEIVELAQLLEVLKLEKSVTGKGHVNATFKTSDGAAYLNDLDVLLTLDGGQSLILTGDLGKLGDPTDVSIDTNIRLYTDDNIPPSTMTLRKLKLIGVDMQLTAVPGGIPQRRMVIETNGFTLDTRGEGPPPISFSEISRTPEGHVKIGKLVLLIGPPEAHFIVLEGSIDDAFKGKGIDITGTMDLPIGSLVAAERFQASDTLGHILGGFRLIGDLDKLSLSDLNAKSEDGDLFNLSVEGSIENVLKVSNVMLNIEADIPSGADVLKTLDLTPIKTGPVKLTTKISSHGTIWDSQATISVADSQVNFTMGVDLADPHPTVRGQIESDLIKISEIREIVSAALQLAKLNEQEDAAKENTPLVSDDGKKTEPLVLPKPDQENAEASAENTEQLTPFLDVTLQPLVQAILLSGMDLSFKIDLRKIEGEKGTSSLTTDLEMKDNKARFGPMTLEYGNAHFDLSGSMDLNKDSDSLKFSGTTGGWNFGEIMRELKIKKRASGILNAKFDISGSHTSMNDFLSSMNGNATVSMRNGSIDSQLLDIAGLGVIPWLFSKDRGPRVSIVCLRAPLYFSNGRITTKQTVVETDRVQIVIAGNVDLPRKTLDILGQPRRIGKPLSRSPWPFTAVGSFAKPKIKVKDGPRRLSRADGATTMPKRRRLCVPDILQLK